MIYKTLLRKLKIEQHEPHKEPVMNLRAPLGLADPASLVTPVVLLLNDRNIICYLCVANSQRNALENSMIMTSPIKQVV